MKTDEALNKRKSRFKGTAGEIEKRLPEMPEAILKKHGCNASVEDPAEYASSQNEGEIGDKDAASVAGGYPIPHS